MAVYEARDAIYLACAANREKTYSVLASTLTRHHRAHGKDPAEVLMTLELDRALCPRTGMETAIEREFAFDAGAVHEALAAMELPVFDESGSCSSRFTTPAAWATC